MTLKRYLFEGGSDGATTDQTSSEASLIFPGNGTIIYDAASGRNGLGIKFISQTGQQTEGRWNASAANTTMSFRGWFIGPGATPAQQIGILNLRHASGVAVRVFWTTTNTLILSPVTGATITIASGLDPTAQYDISIQVVVGTTGSITATLRSTAGTSLGVTSSNSFNSGTAAIVGAGVGILSNYTQSYTNGWDELAFDDGATTEIPLFSPPDNANYDYMWTGTVWKPNATPQLSQVIWNGGEWVGLDGGGSPTPPDPTVRDNLVLGTYKPDSTTTGLIPGITLTDVTAATTITQAGTAANPYVIQNKRYLNLVSISNSQYVTFKNCAFYGNPNPETSNWTKSIQSWNFYNSNIRFEDCLITRQNPTTENQSGVSGGHNTTFLRCEFTGVSDGIDLNHSKGTWANAFDGPMNLQVLGCYFHDMAYFSPETSRSPQDNASHSDCIQLQGGSNFIIRYNTFDVHLDPNIGQATMASVDGVDGNGNPIHIRGNKYYPDMNAMSALMLSPHLADFHEIYFEYNWVDGGAWSINASAFGKPNVGYTDSGLYVRYNKWGRSMRAGQTATVIAYNTPELHNIGNTYEDNGAPANFRANSGA